MVDQMVEDCNTEIYFYWTYKYCTQWDEAKTDIHEKLILFNLFDIHLCNIGKVFFFFYVCGTCKFKTVPKKKKKNVATTLPIFP